MTFETKTKMWWGSVVTYTENLFNKPKKRLVVHEYYENKSAPSNRRKSMHTMGSMRAQSNRQSSVRSDGSMRSERSEDMGSARGISSNPLEERYSHGSDYGPTNDQGYTDYPQEQQQNTYMGGQDQFMPQQQGGFYPNGAPINPQYQQDPQTYPRNYDQQV